MSFQGPAGFNGPTGPTGITGPQGLQGPAQGPPGTTFYQYGIIPPILQPVLYRVFAYPSGTHFTYTYNSSGVNIYIGTLSGTYSTPPSGSFWTFKNTDTSGNGMGVNFSGSEITGIADGLIYNGNNYSPAVISTDGPAKILPDYPGYSFTLVYSIDPYSGAKYFIII